MSDRPYDPRADDFLQTAARRDALSRMCDVFLQGPGGEVLPLLVAAVREHLED